MSEQTEWKYCAVGNIVKTHTDEDGKIRYGTLTFNGGRKVYLSGKYWDSTMDYITVIGLNRGKRYQVQKINVNLIESVRCKKVYRHKIIEIMNDFEFYDTWWDNKIEDKQDVLAFINRWNSIVK